MTDGLRLVAPFIAPPSHLLLDREFFRQRAEELGGQRKGMDFERHGEVRSGLYEALDPKLSVTAQAEDLDLNAMNQRVKQGTQSDVLIEDHDVAERE